MCSARAHRCRAQYDVFIKPLFVTHFLSHFCVVCCCCCRCCCCCCCGGGVVVVAAAVVVAVVVVAVAVLVFVVVIVFLVFLVFLVLLVLFVLRVLRVLLVALATHLIVAFLWALKTVTLLVFSIGLITFAWKTLFWQHAQNCASTSVFWMLVCRNTGK